MVNLRLVEPEPKVISIQMMCIDDTQYLLTSYKISLQCYDKQLQQFNINYGYYKVLPIALMLSFPRYCSSLLQFTGIYTAGVTQLAV